MVTSMVINQQPHLIMKSLDKNSFEEKTGLEWVDMSMWLKVRGIDSSQNQQFLSACLKVS